MYGAAMYGMFLVVSIFVLKELAPQPAGTVVWWALLAAQGTWGASIAWRRTRLPFATTSLAVSAFSSAAVAVLAALGYAGFLVQGTFAAVAVATLFACNFAESRVHPVEWRKWRAHAERMTAWDILAGRGIPYLRHHDNGDDELASRG